MVSCSYSLQIYNPMHPLERKIILASASPRRSQLLEQAGFNFEVRPQDVEEVWPLDLPAEKVAPYLAQKKAQSAKPLLGENDIILAADSVVLLEDRIFEKPANAQEAQRMLRALSGEEHTVITGVCLLDHTREEVLSGITQVRFAALSDQEIEYYVHKYKPYDKAGSYAIQEWIGLCKITGIKGTYANVMGLPVDLVYRALEGW